MKKCLVIISCSVLFFSCTFGTPTYTTYYKSYFLGDTSFPMNGEIFEVLESHRKIKPREFENLTIKTDSVDGWKVDATKTTANGYKAEINIVSGEAVINKESIVLDNSHLGNMPIRGIIPTDFPICVLEFYMDDSNIRQPDYWQPRDWDPQQYYKYDMLEYFYVYVAEPLTISERKIDENDEPWYHIQIYDYDLDFTKPGWYKICSYDINYNNSKFINDQKHMTAQNTNFYN